MNPQKLSDESLLKMFKATSEEILEEEIINRGLILTK